jgi:S-layer homology domain
MRRSLGVLALMAVPLSAMGQTPALGPDFQVNSYTTGYQVAPQVASDAEGNFVIVWSGQGPGLAGSGVWARRFDNAGTPLDPEFIVNGFTNAFGTSVAANASGSFVVVWQSYQDGDASGVFARGFDSTGTPQTDVLAVNTYTTGSQHAGRVAMDDGGDFVVVWTNAAPQDGSGYGVFGQRFDAAGNKLGSEFPVNTQTADQQWFQDVAMNSSGDFVVVWSSQPENPCPPIIPNCAMGPEVWGQRYGSDGLPQGAEFHVNQYTTSAQHVPRVGMDAAGNFVVTWFSYGQTGEFYDVLARRFDSAGTALGDEFPVNTTTSGNQGASDVAVDSTGAFTITWDSNQNGVGVWARRYEASGRPLGREFQLNATTSIGQNGPSIALDERGGFVIAWQCAQLGTHCDGSYDAVRARRGGVPNARPMTVDFSGGNVPAGGSNLNGVLEAEELVAVAPAWNNNSGADLVLTGTASDFTGPAGPEYLLMDAAADYGTIPGDATNDCTVTGDCLTVGVSGARPTAHWDATFEEALSSGATKTWTLHVGESFLDVPVAHQFYAFIENIFHNGITGGCGGGNFCPNNSVTRGQMAVFLLKSEHGSDYVPPPCSGTFPDVSCPGHQFADWIEQLSAEGITGGCGGGNYCPDTTVTRAQMAVFLLKTKNGSTYTPPDCAGIFGDVTCPSQFANWIEQLSAEGITGGCGGGNYCPDNPNNRGQMAVFLTKTFGLQLYGP